MTALAGSSLHYMSLDNPPRRSDIYTTLWRRVCQHDDLWDAWRMGTPIPNDQLRQGRMKNPAVKGILDMKSIAG